MGKIKCKRDGMLPKSTQMCSQFPCPIHTVIWLPSTKITMEQLRAIGQAHIPEESHSVQNLK